MVYPPQMLQLSDKNNTTEISRLVSCPSYTKLKMCVRKNARIIGVVAMVILLTYYFFVISIRREMFHHESLSISGLNVTSYDIVKRQDLRLQEKWCHLCVNYHQYKALIYPDGLSDTYLDMVMFTQTYYTEDFIQRRRFLRKYMLNSTNFPALKVKHIFVFGTCDRCNLTHLSEEAKLYNDILVFNFEDTYRNLTIKTLVALNWIYHHYNTEVILRSNDDAIFNVTDIHQTILKQVKQTRSPTGSKQTASATGSKQTGNPDGSVNKVILGHCFDKAHVVRDLNHKWGVSLDVYPNNSFPRYCSGESIAFTRSAIPSLLDQTPSTPLTLLDDVDVGILAKAAGDLNITNIPNWEYASRQNLNVASLRRFHVVHSVAAKAKVMQKLWQCLSTPWMDQYSCNNFRF